MTKNYAQVYTYHKNMNEQTHCIEGATSTI